MLARDIMSFPVVSVPPAMPVAEAAALLHARRIGGVPVMSGHGLLGMVTGEDLIRRHEIGTDHAGAAPSWWQRLRAGPSELAEAYVKTHGPVVRHVMSSHVWVVPETAELGAVADLFAQRAIGRAPVVSGERVVGIIARADLVRAVAGCRRRSERAGVTDEEIRRDLLAELAAQRWWNGNWENVFVAHGVVIFKGVVQDEQHRLAARVAAENVPGVRAVRDDRLLASEMPIML